MRNTDMDHGDEALVWVRPHFRDWRQASYHLSDLREVFWGDGVDEAYASRLYAYVQCDERVEGERLHPCQSATAPHRIRVCILKQDNEDLFDHLRTRCSERSGATRSL